MGSIDLTQDAVMVTRGANPIRYFYNRYRVRTFFEGSIQSQKRCIVTFLFFPVSSVVLLLCWHHFRYSVANKTGIPGIHFPKIIPKLLKPEPTIIQQLGSFMAFRRTG